MAAKITEDERRQSSDEGSQRLSHTPEREKSHDELFDP